MSQKLNAAIAVIGIDIGKNSFHVVGHDHRGAIVLRQKWSRGQVETRLADLSPCLVGMEACVGAHHLSRKLQMFGHDARLMPAKYVRPYSTGQKNDFRDAEAIAEAVQRPTMKFVATKTADQLDLQALHRVRDRLVGQRTGAINQIRAFLLERGIAVRQGLHSLRFELPGILATRTDVLSPRMLRIIEGLAEDWRRLDERIEGLSSEIETLARSSRAQWWPRSAQETCSRKAATSAPGLDWCRSKYRPATARSSAVYRGAAIATCAHCSCKPRGLCWSRSNVGSAMASTPGSKPPRNDCTTTCWRLRSPTSSPGSPGRSSTRDAPSRASRRRRRRPDLLDPRAVRGAVKARPGDSRARRQGSTTAGLDDPYARRVCARRPGRRNDRKAQTKEQREVRSHR